LFWRVAVLARESCRLVQDRVPLLVNRVPSEVASTRTAVWLLLPAVKDATLTLTAVPARPPTFRTPGSIVPSGRAVLGTVTAPGPARPPPTS
jgi:hypothetical protein